MRTSITKSYNFEAAHKLPNHAGKCARLHGHSYRFEVAVTGEVIKSGSSVGMVMDFADLSKVVETEILNKWDHQFLNDILPFTTTAELLATEIFKILKNANMPVTRVRLWETAKAYATVEE